MCQSLIFDEEKGRRFGIHEVMLQYSSVSNLIRRGEFKKLDQELETGSKRGMQTFDHSIEMRISEGWVPSVKKKTGYSAQEIAEYLDVETDELETTTIAR
jgi:twitching motility protein PilT